MNIESYLAEVRHALPRSLRDDPSLLDEIADHLRCAVEQYVSAGVSQSDALAAAIVSFGEPQSVARAYRRGQRSVCGELATAALSLVGAASFSAIVAGIASAVYAIDAAILVSLAHRLPQSCGAISGAGCSADLGPAGGAALVAAVLLAAGVLGLVGVGRLRRRLRRGRPLQQSFIRTSALVAVAWVSYAHSASVQDGLGMPLTSLIAVAAVVAAVIPLLSGMYRRHAGGQTTLPSQRVT